MKNHNWDWTVLTTWKSLNSRLSLSYVYKRIFIYISLSAEILSKKKFVCRNKIMDFST